jgi:hypothetical protein
MVAPRKLLVINPISADGNLVENEELEKNFSIVKEIYSIKGVSNKFKVIVNSKSDIENIESSLSIIYHLKSN